MGLSQTAYRVLVRTGVDRMFWRLNSRSLRILCYHGVCPDNTEGLSWIPDCFVTASAFADQMRHVASHAQVLPLAEGVSRLGEGTLPPRAVCITFDDGFANNLHLAYPVLSKYGISATIFLSSAYLETGELFPFLRFKLLALSLGTAEAKRLAMDYKSAPLESVLKRSEKSWEAVRNDVTELQRETLRPLTIPELGRFDPALVEFGGHSHTHCILANETEPRRLEEIRLCTVLIRQWTGRPVRLFAYPNGGLTDFGGFDQKALRAQGIAAAVTGIAGANTADTDPLVLRRYPVGLYHDTAGFRAELSGLRSAILSIA